MDRGLYVSLYWGFGVPSLREAMEQNEADEGRCSLGLPMQPGRRAVRADGKRGIRSVPMAMGGTVKFFNSERGYGFIKPDDGGRDVFVHITAVERAGLKTLNEGQRITFDVEPDKKGKGPKAVNLVVS